MKIHFAHANGFPASSYRQMFDALPRQFEVIAVEKFAHSPSFPVSNNWERQAEELIHYVESNADSPVYAVGHSFGAVISYIAVCKKAALFHGLIMLDPPLVAGLIGRVVDLFKGTRFFDRITPAQKAQTRCTSWPLGTDLTAYFQNKGLFKNMQVECIQDYVSAAVAKGEEGYQLAFDHQVEADVFRTIPTRIHKKHGKLPVPGLLLTGEATKVCRPHRISAFLKTNQLSHQTVPGGHMFPLENPFDVAQIIAQQINSWDKEKGDQE